MPAAVPPLFVGVAAWLVPGAELAAAAREGDEALLGAAEDWLDAGVLGLPAALEAPLPPVLGAAWAGAAAWL